MYGKKLIVYELNEVPLRIFDYFAKLWPNSRLRRLNDQARRYETCAEDSGHLSPWITWPTLHRGVTNLEHEITHFGQDLSKVNVDFPPIWSILAKRGVHCGMFGSLHSYPLPADLDGYAFYVPDTFAAGPECFPKRLDAFQGFNLAMVDRSGRDVRKGFALKAAIDFMLAAPSLGLRASTVGKMVKQLASEQINRRRTVRRRTGQVQIAFDFFMRALKRERPDASFFFTNHVASSMHRYWPALFPGDYETNRFDGAWQDTWYGEIPFVMTAADAQIGELMHFVDGHPGYALIVAGSMGQAADQQRQRVDTMLQLKDHAAFATAMGLAPDEWSKERAMAPQYVFRVVPGAVDRFMQSAGGLTINGKSTKVTRISDDRVAVEIKVLNIKDHEIAIDLKGQWRAPADLGFINLSLQDAAGANANHVPEGMCLVYEPGAAGHSDGPPRQISTREIAPSILANFGVERPSYMSAASPL